MINQPNFDHYDDPARALRIWNAYIPDVETLRTGDEESFDEKLINILSKCRDSWDLDISLDSLTSPKQNYTGKLSGPVDIDSNGSWANYVRLLEEHN